MATDDQIRRVLLASLPDVDEQDGWDRVQARIAPARRRRLTQVAAAATAVAVVVVIGITARSWLGDTSPDVADGTTTTVISTTTAVVECLDARIDSGNADYLDRWTTSTVSLQADQCVLAGIAGPEPETIPDGLGVEMPLHPDRLVDDTDLPRGRVLLPIVDYYPIVHIGQVGDTDFHGFLYWVEGETTGAPTPNIGGAIGAPGDTMAAQEGIWSAGIAYPTITVHTVVADEAAIVAIEVDGRPYAWQRPVAKASVFVIDETQLSASPTSIAVTVFDRTGTVIDRYEQGLD